jgi:pyruvate formate-lyase activating enzyme-like uncharacterized protein
MDGYEVPNVLYASEAALPGPLRQIASQVRERAEARGNGEADPSWPEDLARVRRDMPGLRCEADGEIMVLGDLSPGCSACKQGAWDCIFVTFRCNLDCAFCYSPWSGRAALREDRPGSAFGRTPEEMIVNYRGLQLKGLAFSGGEPFLAGERLFEWLGRLKAADTTRYCWVYTNGLLASAGAVSRLAALGLDEIRFNMAATGYHDPKVLANAREAARRLPLVTVEIPAIPDHGDRLLSALSAWADAGIRCLNVHELLCEPGTNAETLPGPRLAVSTPDGHRTVIDPRSRELALAVLRKVADDGLALSVNFCSLRSKLRQVRERRRRGAEVFRAEHEELSGDELVTCCLFDESGRLFFIAPSALAKARRLHPSMRVARLKRMLPLAAVAEPIWTAMDLLDDPRQMRAGEGDHG